MFQSLDIAIAQYLPSFLRLHRLLVVEKRRMIAAAYRRARTVVGAVHERIDAREFDDLDALANGPVTLQSEIALIERISTWPWHLEPMCVTACAVLVPVLLWVAQRALRTWLRAASRSTVRMPAPGSLLTGRCGIVHSGVAVDSDACEPCGSEPRAKRLRATNRSQSAADAHRRPIRSVSSRMIPSGPRT